MLNEPFIQTSFLSIVKCAKTFWATGSEVFDGADEELSIGVRSFERPSSARRFGRNGLSSARDAIPRLMFELNEGRTRALAVFLAITSRCIEYNYQDGVKLCP